MWHRTCSKAPPANTPYAPRGSIMSVPSRFSRIFVLAFGLTFVAWSSAGALPLGGGHQVSYGINMTPGTSNANDITSVFIFESNGAQLNVDYGFTIPGTGVSSLTHTIPFAPTSALIAGIGRGIPGVGDGKDHIYLVVNDAFAESIVGMLWSEVFPGTGGVRVRHNEFIELLADASAGDLDALEAVRTFATVDAAAGWFDPDGPFAVMEFTFTLPPVGGSIPAPATLELLAAALVGLGLLAVERRRRAHRTAA